MKRFWQYLGVIWLGVITAAPPLAAQDPWDPDIKSLRGQLEVLAAILQQQTALLTEPNEFRHNVIDTLQMVPDVIDNYLKDNARPLTFTDHPFWSIVYSRAGAI